jgi:ligand-binding sensor protein
MEVSIPMEKFNLNDFSTIELKEFIDMEFLQKFQDDFAEAIGVASITVDIHGNPVTQPSQFTNFCMNLTRGTNEGLKRCMGCDSQGGTSAAKTGRPAIYDCHAGLVDFAAPIMLQGKQIGSILGGQVLTESYDEVKVRKIAREIGIDEDEYLRALKKIEIVPRNKIEKAAELLYLVAKNISEMCYRKYRVNKVVEVLNDNLGQISASIQEMASFTDQVAGNQSELNLQIQDVNRTSEQISQFVQSMKIIESRTKMLGLNASIEAARAGESGRGFGIVAQEIQRLSDDSKQLTGKISEFTVKIQETVNKTTGMGESTVSAAQQQTAYVEEIVASIEELTTVANQLFEMSR